MRLGVLASQRTEVIIIIIIIIIITTIIVIIIIIIAITRAVHELEYEAGRLGLRIPHDVLELDDVGAFLEHLQDLDLALYLNIRMYIIKNSSYQEFENCLIDSLCSYRCVMSSYFKLDDVGALPENLQDLDLALNLNIHQLTKNWKIPK